MYFPRYHQPQERLQRLRSDIKEKGLPDKINPDQDEL
jgi:hypothetical protein